LADRFLAGVAGMGGAAGLGGVTVHGFGADEPLVLGPDRLPVISLTMASKDPATVGMFLDADWNIAVRTGLHCAPLAHEALGTAPEGSVRLGFGAFNTMEQVDRVLEALGVVG